VVEFEDLRRARERLGDAIYRSPCARSETLSRRLDCELYLKLENLQMTGSFKERGVLNKLASLGSAERARGVIAASAGNHGQALAFAARRQGVAATIVMPRSAPLIKVTSTRAHGAEVVLFGDDFDEAAAHAQQLAAERKLLPIAPFDDDEVIAGQGTIGLELLEQLPELDAVVVSVGGGGLAAGVSLAVKTLRPQARVYGVEPRVLPSLSRALRAGVPTAVEQAQTLADGIAVRRVGQRPLPLLQRHLDAVVEVDEEEIAAAILALLEDEKTVAEGAGAAPLAALMQGALQLSGKRVVLVVSGGNIDVNVLSRIIDRGLLKSGRMMRTRVLIPDRPGSLAALLGVVAGAGANVLQVQHDRLGARTEPGLTSVELVLETRGYEHIAGIERAIDEAGWLLAD